MEDGEKSLNSPPLPPPHRLRRSPSASQGAIKSQRTTETKLLHRRRREQSIKCTSGNRGRRRGGDGGRQAKPAASVEEHAFILGCFRANSPKTSLPRARAKQLNVPRPLTAISPHCIAKTVGPADKCTSCRYRICHIKDSRSDAEYKVRLKKLG